MQVEMIGCTSAGKTTLARHMLQAAQALGIDLQLSDDFVLRRVRMNWIKSEFMRRRLIEALALLMCLLVWRKHRDFYAMAVRASLKAPGAWTYRLTVARSAFRKIGIYEIVRRLSSAAQIILLDNEGVLQASHTLFVHCDPHPCASEMSAFVELAPLPDLVVYLQQPEDVLFRRTLARGHDRIPDRTPAKVDFFIKQALETFEVLRRHPRLESRLLVVDGERIAIASGAQHGDPQIETVAGLVITGLGNANQAGADDSEQPPQENGRHDVEQTPRPPAELALRLAEAFNSRNVNYCHWKSNLSLDKALAGEEDLDLLVHRSSMPAALNVLNDLGFKAATVRSAPSAPGVAHFYGLDAPSGELVHVHLFSHVLTGESFVKSHLLPIDRMLLDTQSYVGPVRVASKPAELVLFVLRVFIKHGSLPDLIRIGGASQALREELAWLRADGEISQATALLRRYCPVIDEGLFRRGIETIETAGSLLTRIRLGQVFRWRLRPYAKYTALGRLLAYVPVVRAYVSRRISGRRDKTLQTGGALIAIVGADATGKSTLVAESRRWLGSAFAVRAVHAGKPPSSWLTAPVNALSPLRRHLLPHVRHDRRGGSDPSAKTSPWGGTANASLSFLYAIRAVTLAWDRAQLLRRARRLAANGEIVICDRYPTQTVGMMDSPRLREQQGRGGIGGAFYNWLTRIENRLYQQMPPPDTVLKLRVSLETAKRRNHSRSQNGVMDADDYLVARHQQMLEWHREDAGYSCDIDTEPALEETFRSVKKAIWGSL